MFTWFITKILSFLSGGALNSVLKYFERKEELQNDRDRLRTQIITEQIKAEIEVRKEASKMLAIEQGWWVTAMIRPLFAYPLIIWWWAVILDSIFSFDLVISKLPSPLNEWSGWIIGAYFVTRPFEKIGRSFINRRK